MSEETIRAGIAAFFKTEWDAIDGAIPIQYPNQPFDQNGVAAWGRFSILPADRFDGSIGTGHVRHIGIAFLQVFLVADTGTKAATDTADAFATVFDNKTLALDDGTSVQFHRVSTKHLGLTPENLYQVSASVTYRADKFA